MSSSSPSSSIRSTSEQRRFAPPAHPCYFTIAQEQILQLFANRTNQTPTPTPQAVVSVVDEPM